MEQRSRTPLAGARGLLAMGLALAFLHEVSARRGVVPAREPAPAARPAAVVAAPATSAEVPPPAPSAASRRRRSLGATTAPVTGARPPRRSSEPKPYDQPNEAQAFFLRKRVPPGETALPTERYFEARARMALMPRHSTREGRLLPPRSTGESEPEGAVLEGWEQLGPGNIGGRTRALILHPDNADPALPNTMYAAGVTGGVWKTINGGATWAPLDDLMANLAVTTMAMDLTNSEVVYAGTGEIFTVARFRGAGIFRTTNGGATWSRLASTNTADFHYVSKIVISPNDPQRLYAATGTGVWRSTDGGSTWTVILGPGPAMDCSDLAIRTDQPTDHLVAACGVLTPGAVHLNTDAGGAGAWSTFLNEPGMGRVSLAIAPSSQNVMYAMSASRIPTPSGNFTLGLHAVHRSEDGGRVWDARVRNNNPTRLNTVLLTNPLFAFLNVCYGQAVQFINQGDFDNVIAVDPLDPTRVWAGGIDLFRSDDGGANWGLASHWWLTPSLNPRYAHADQHAIVFHPAYDGVANTTMFVGNDGGLFRTDNARAATSTGARAPCLPDLDNGLVTWTALNNSYGVTQFYHGVPYPDGDTYFGGTQDNGVVRGSNAAGPNAWSALIGGDGGAVAVPPEDYGGPLRRERRSVHPEIDRRRGDLRPRDQRHR